jgi:uncharacterized protein YecE (DUF72 family)
MSDQFDLFGAPTPAKKKGPPLGVVTDEDRELAARLPPDLRLGTSSWSFPGWEGLVYDRPCSVQTLARHGLAAYAQNPLFRTVGVDRSHYQPLTVPQWQGYAAQVPQDFRFLVKAHEYCSLRRFPEHPRYGSRGGQDNVFFLDPHYARDEVVAPTVRGLGEKLGVLLFQFAAQDLRPIGGPEGFCDRLYAFLSRLPAGPTYAVEVRDRSLMIPRLGEALAASGTMPCLAYTHDLPDLEWQYRNSPAAQAPVTVMRWLLRRGLSYGDAQQRYGPFSRLVEPDERTRQQAVDILLRHARPGFLILNNKAEGSSPESLRALARQLVFHVERAGQASTHTPDGA